MWTHASNYILNGLLRYRNLRIITRINKNSYAIMCDIFDTWSITTAFVGAHKQNSELYSF